MEKNRNKESKELYRQLRTLSCQELWTDEVPRFERAPARERLDRVSLIRALGVVFSESGTAAEKEKARQWLLKLLRDPEEKIRRYAMAALPKLGSGVNEEEALLAVLKSTQVDREKKFLGKTLDKIGGAATLKVLEKEAGVSIQTEQKVRAHVARTERPTVVKMDRTLPDFAGVRIHLRGRSGLEGMVRSEAAEFFKKRRQFRVEKHGPGWVELTPVAPFSLGDLYAMRCFGSLNFVLGRVRPSDGAGYNESLAEVIASPLTRKILKAFTEGALRYRLEFVGKGARRGAVREAVNRAYALSPEILNDARQAPWAVDVHSTGKGDSVELRPRFSPDPRLWFRQGDVPAASHPPLAAAMARLAGPWKDEMVWDPFCGSGLELIERALLGGVRRVIGTDLSAEALSIAEGNFAAARLQGVEAEFVRADFRDFSTLPALKKDRVSLVLSNPPMGMRVPIPNLRGLIGDLFRAAAEILPPGGRLVFANPLKMDSPQGILKLESRQVVDFGGFNARMEKYVRA